MISQRYWIDKNTPLPLQNSIMNNTVWEKMLSCWRFLGNKDAFLASCHKSIFFPPLSLLATLSSLISSSTKDFSSLASSCMLELPLRKPWGFNKYPTTLYSLCQTVCTGEEKKKSMTVMTNFHFLPLSSRLKERYRRTTPQWAHQQRYPLIWWNTSSSTNWMTFVWHFVCHLVYLLLPHFFIWNLLVAGNLELCVFSSVSARLRKSLR